MCCSHRLHVGRTKCYSIEPCRNRSGMLLEKIPYCISVSLNYNRTWTNWHWLAIALYEQQVFNGYQILVHKKVWWMTTGPIRLKSVEGELIVRASHVVVLVPQWDNAMWSTSLLKRHFDVRSTHHRSRGFRRWRRDTSLWPMYSAITVVWTNGMPKSGSKTFTFESGKVFSDSLLIGTRKCAEHVISIA